MVKSWATATHALVQTEFMSSSFFVVPWGTPLQQKMLKPAIKVPVERIEQ